MLTLIAPVKNTIVNDWEDKINDMAVGYKIVIDEGKDEPEIIHCREHYVGEEAVSKYLVELSKFMESWCKCACEQ